MTSYPPNRVFEFLSFWVFEFLSFWVYGERTCVGTVQEWNPIPGHASIEEGNSRGKVPFRHTKTKWQSGHVAKDGFDYKIERR